MKQGYELDRLLDFFGLAERLKGELRHSWTSRRDRRESVAEHTWMMSLMALVLMSEADLDVDPLKVLKMVVIHDLPEAVAGDAPFRGTADSLREKHRREEEALEALLSLVENREVRDEMEVLWREFEECESAEAKFVRAIDTLDVSLQHMIADLSTWDDDDFAWTLSPIQERRFDSSGVLRQLKDRANARIIAKVEAGGAMSRLPQEDLRRWTSRTAGDSGEDERK